MDFEWDEEKRARNLRKHGFDFIDADKVFDGPTVTIVDDRDAYGEERFIAFGLLEGRVVAVVYAEMADTIRVISIRKATKHEQALFFKRIKN